MDYLKVTSLSNLAPDITSALTYRPVLVHVGFGIGDSAASYADFDWGWFNAQLRRAGSPHIAMHVEVSTHNWPYKTDLRFQTRDEARSMVAHLTELCHFLRDRLEVPLLLENMDYMGRELKPGYGVFRTSVEPALLWGLVEEMEVGGASTSRTSASPPTIWAWTRKLSLTRCRSTQLGNCMCAAPLLSKASACATTTKS